MPHRIAIDYTAALQQGGGIGRYVRELVKSLARLDHENQYRLFAAGQDKADLPPPLAANFSWSPTRLNTDWLARIWHRGRLPIPIERWTGAIDLLHATDFTLPPVRKGTKTILTVHDLSFVRTPETALPSLRDYLNRVVPRSVRRADHILADSEATRQDVIELYQTPPDKVSVLYSGVEPSFQSINNPETIMQVREKYRIGGQPYILSVGTVQPRKNYARLVEAVHRLPHSDLKVVIAGGKGWLSDDLYQTVDKLNMADRVVFAGYVDDADLPALYSSAELFALNSLYEGFGLPLLEAMACGVPTVTSNISSLPEVGGDASILVDPYDVDALADAIGRILEDSALKETMIGLGITQARRFSWEKSAIQLLGHYQKTI